MKNRESGEVKETSFRAKERLVELIPVVFTLGFYQSTTYKQARKYHQKVRQVRSANLAGVKKAVEGVRVYQGSTEEVERELGRPLARVDTGEPLTCLQEEDSFWLRVKTRLLGADLVVHYQPGSSIGTPVRYSDQRD